MQNLCTKCIFCPRLVFNLNIKKMKKIVSIGILASALFFGVACSNTAETNKNSIEYTSDYICPMHCEGSGSDSSGTCPVCGMDYVENSENH